MSEGNDLANRCYSSQGECWQCPTCHTRYWTLYPQERFDCMGEMCRTRCIAITLTTFCKPDNKDLPAATARLTIKHEPESPYPDV